MKYVKQLALIAFAIVSGYAFAYNGGYENSLLTDTVINSVTYKGFGEASRTSVAPVGAVTYGQYAQMRALKSVDLSKVTSIADAGFAYSTMTSATLSASIDAPSKLGFIAFGGCTNLTTLTVSGFGWYDAAKEPFRDCTKLTTLVADCAPPSIGSTAFAALFPNVNVIKVAKEQKAAWQAKNYVATVQTDESGTDPEPELVKVTLDARDGRIGADRYRNLEFEVGTSISDLPEPELAGWTFAGWYTAVDGGAKVSDGFVVTEAITLYAHWTQGGDPEPEMVAITFDAGDGRIGTDRYRRVEISAGSKLENLPEPVLAGWTFVGWYTEAAAGEKVTAGAVINQNVSLYAHWTKNGGGGDDPRPVETEIWVTFESNGGSAVPSQKVSSGDPLPAVRPDDPVKAGFGFGGWFTDAACTREWNFENAVTASMTLYAKWGKPLYNEDGEVDPESPEYVTPELYEDKEEVSAFAGDATYNGWIRNRRGTIDGLLTIKAAKPGKKDNISKLTVSYTPFGGKKKSIKLPGDAMPVAEGYPIVDIPGVGSVRFGGECLEGVDVDLQAAADLSKSKNKAVKAVYTSRLKKMAGSWTFALNSDTGYITFSVTVSKAGKGSLTGLLPDGTKVTASAQGMLGDEALAIPFTCSKKATFGFVFWVDDSGKAGLSDVSQIKTGKSVFDITSWTVPGTRFALGDGMHVFECADAGIALPFSVNGKKWTLPKQQKKLGDDDPNPYAVKLTYTAKTGLVKGSFAVPLPGGKKTVKWTVNGIVVNGRIYGSATAKGYYPVSVTAE